MRDKRVAVLMTCHNRREKTLASLEALFKQVLAPEVCVQVYLVDDGSTDGTAEALQAIYSEVKVLRGDGTLFWNGGMRLAFSEALKATYDYYLWLNDDTLLAPSALGNLLKTHHHLAQQGNSNSIVVGSTQDPVTGVLTYGGVVRPSHWRRLNFSLVEPDKEPKECETMNGNCVLIPNTVAEKVGTLDKAFTHAMGDYDYGLRTRKLGCSVWLAPGYVGSCPRNSQQGSWADLELPIRDRLKKVSQPKALPFLAWKVFAQRHAGLFWPMYWLSPYAKLLLLSVFGRLRRNRI